jgi:chromosome segregation ATPase
MLAEYENNIKSLTQTIADGLSQLESSKPDDPEAVDAMLAKLNADLQSAKAEMTKFKSYTMGLGRADKEVAKLRFDTLQKLVSSQERQIQSAEHKINSEALAGGGSAADRVRGQVDDQNKTLERSANRLQGVKQTLVEVDDNAGIIETELMRNRQTLLGAKGKVEGTLSELKGAGRILNRMFVRNVAQRAAIFGMIVAGGAVILLVLIACLSTPPNPNLFPVTTGAPLTTRQP